jgi:hypothetical protein
MSSSDDVTFATTGAFDDIWVQDFARKSVMSAQIHESTKPFVA